MESTNHERFPLAIQTFDFSVKLTFLAISFFPRSDVAKLARGLLLFSTR